MQVLQYELDTSLEIKCAEVNTADITFRYYLPNHIDCQIDTVIFDLLVIVLSQT